jgi:2-hydroxychromene-2-carboxylate isomerase
VASPGYARGVKRIDFFYDFSCPYAYLAHTQIEALCERAGAELVWCPMLLGGVFQAIGAPAVPAAAMSAPKARLNALDMHRWADHFGVPLNMPPTHPNRSVLALRATLASGDLPRASKALFRAYWVLGRDVSQPEVVKEALDEAGFDGAALVARADAPEVKAELRARTDEAVAAGVFGAPSFRVTAPGVNGDLYWGQDRLELVEKALGGWSVSAEPPAVAPGVVA